MASTQARARRLRSPPERCSGDPRPRTPRKPHPGQGGGGTFSRVFRRGAAQALEAEGDLFFHARAEELVGAVLKDHADLPPEGLAPSPRYGFARKVKCAIALAQAEEAGEEGGLASPVLADDGQSLPAPDVEVNARKRPGAVRVAVVKAPQGDQRRGRGISREGAGAAMWMGAA